MEVVADSIHLHKKATLVDCYKMWKQPLHKWDQYVYNRHKSLKVIDSWSRYIVGHSQGNIAAYNCGGMFFSHFIDDLTVIEHDPCPVTVPGMTYLGNKQTASTDQFNNQFDTLIMSNPITLKYNHSMVNFFTVPGVSRAGWKPNIIDWVRPNGTIFLSFSDWHLFYDRLKFSPGEIIDKQLADLETIGIKCINKNIENSNLDYVNGNIKLELKKQ